MQKTTEQAPEVIVRDDAEITSPDGVVVMPAYVPTIEETIKASGGHRGRI